jgi:hypothetical protein
MIKEIKFSNTLSLWKTEFDTSNISEIVEISKKHIDSLPEISNDGYTYYIGVVDVEEFFDRKINNELDKVLNFSINSCITLANTSFNTLSTDAWINLVRHKDQKQKFLNNNGEISFHKHTELNRKVGLPEPMFTFVSYFQIQNNLTNNDGVLLIKDIDGTIYEYLPHVGDCLIMDGDTLHVPNQALNSTIDRIVLAGNVRLDKIKKEKTLF